MKDIEKELASDIMFQQVWFSLQFGEHTQGYSFLERKMVRELIYHHCPKLPLSEEDNKLKGIIYPSRVSQLKAEDSYYTRLLLNLC